MPKLRHDRPDCNVLVPPAAFEALKVVWPAEFNDEAGNPVVTLTCPGCHSDVAPERFVTISTSMLPPPG